LYRNDDFDLARVALAIALEIYQDLPDPSDKQGIVMRKQTHNLAGLLGIKSPVSEGTPTMNDTSSHFLRRRREELGISQSDLALRLMARGVRLSRAAIGKWERGTHQPKLDDSALDALADALHWSLDELIEAMGADQG
jgi:DNA-binding XRE family transcriptional regulator